MIFAYKMLENVSDNNMSLILKKFNSISIKVCEGQQFDMDYEKQESVSEEDYLEMIKSSPNLYGDGNAGEKIAQHISAIKIDRKLILKNLT